MKKGIKWMENNSKKAKKKLSEVISTFKTEYRNTVNEKLEKGECDPFLYPLTVAAAAAATAATIASAWLAFETYYDDDNNYFY
jgi:hypothetical protein